MPPQPDFDVQTVHRYFAAGCFNKAWEFIENHDRSAEDDLVMLQTAMASLWHRSQPGDAEPKNLSIGCWQVSRVYALLGRADHSRRYNVRQLSVREQLHCEQDAVQLHPEQG